MTRFHLKHLWFVLAAYGVWFAIFSGFEELFAGKYWKVFLALTLGIFVYFIIEVIKKD